MDGANLRSLVASTVGQLMLNDENDANDEVKRSNLVLSTLVNWYQESQSPDSSSKSATTTPTPLVVILEDFEGFSPQLLQDFILNLM